MKFEFGDLYKFIVSLGVVLITLSVLIPWLFLKEPFDLFRHTAELNDLTKVARAAIEARQETVANLMTIIPVLSLIAALIGFVFIVAGLMKWHGNQLLLDEQNRLDVALKKQSLRDATADEIETEAENEFKALASTEQELETFALFARDYRGAEVTAFKQIAKTYGDKYAISCNKIIDGVELDILMEGKHFLAKDYLLEIKYIRKGFNYGWLRESFLKLQYARNIYTQHLNKSPNTLLLIFVEPQLLENKKYDEFLQKIRQEPFGRSGKDRILIISMEEFKRLEGAELERRLGVYA